MTCEYKLVIQIVAGEVQKTVVYYMCSSDNYKFIVSRELKGEKNGSSVVFEFSFIAKLVDMVTSSQWSDFCRQRMNATVFLPSGLGCQVCWNFNLNASF